MLEKIYAVTFMSYTNCFNNTVWNEDEGKYLMVGKEFLVKESDLPKYQKYGDGYREVMYVGSMEVNE